MENREVLYWILRTIKAVSEEIERFSYNTALSGLMELLNFINTGKKKSRDFVECFIKLLAPFAPFICEDLWSRFGHNRSIFDHN